MPCFYGSLWNVEINWWQPKDDLQTLGRCESYKTLPLRPYFGLCLIWLSFRRQLGGPKRRSIWKFRSNYGGEDPGNFVWSQTPLLTNGTLYPMQEIGALSWCACSHDYVYKGAFSLFASGWIRVLIWSLCADIRQSLGMHLVYSAS